MEYKGRKVSKKKLSIGGTTPIWLKSAQKVTPSKSTKLASPPVFNLKIVVWLRYAMSPDRIWGISI
jgi:hypothetical protein